MRRIYRSFFNRGPRVVAKVPAILMYHRVARLQHDPWGLAVDPERFDAQMAWLASERLVLSLHDFVDRLHAGNLPSESAAITFDDGYLDNLTSALPTLRRYGLCATLFVVGNAVGSGHGFWWDELARLILENTTELDSSVTVGGTRIPLSWPAGACSPRPDQWRAWERPSYPREVAYVAVWQALRNASSEARLDALRQLRMLVPSVDMEPDRAMNVRELHALTAGGSFTLGGHTMTHPALSTLAIDALQEELAESLVVCRSLSSAVRFGFAYPYGDLDERVRLEVEASGFAWACTTRCEAVDRQRFDLFALPRVAVGDWKPERLATGF